MKLNSEQTRAIATVNGPILVFAGAGSGKTRVLTERIRKMIASGITAGHITAVTFTNKSAMEMKERLGDLPRNKRKGLIVSTFHSLGVRILRAHISEIEGFKAPFTILSEDDRLRILAEIYSRNKLDPADLKKDGVPQLFSRMKNTLQSPERFLDERGLPEGLLDLFNAYTDALKGLNALDFDDLLRFPIQIFKKNEDLLKSYRKAHTHYLVDEFQDTNPIQYEFLRMLTHGSRNIFAVGDDDQSIYGFRGSDVQLILRFKEDFPGAEVHRLESNYRSQANIVEAASVVIQNNADRAEKSLKATRPPGEPIMGIFGKDEEEEAFLTAEEIRKRMLKDRRRPEDFAVLLRTNFQSRAFENAFRQAAIPHKVLGGYRFFDRREVRDFLAYLYVIANQRDEINLLRILTRPGNGLGEVSVRSLRNAAGEDGIFNVLVKMQSEPGLVPGLKREATAAIAAIVPLVEEFKSKFARSVLDAAKELLPEIKLESLYRREGEDDQAIKLRMLNVSELINVIKKMEQDAAEDGEKFTLFDLLAQIGLLTSDDEEETGGRVQIMTCHVSKGLEFPVVFLGGLMEGLFPGERALTESTDVEGAIAEERRLFYVGMTRARDVLYLSGSTTKKKFGEIIEMQPSRFLEEIPKGQINWLQSIPGTPRSPENVLTDFNEALNSFRNI